MSFIPIWPPSWYCSHQARSQKASSSGAKVRTIGVSPVQRLDADLAVMLPLPPIPLHLGLRNRTRLGRDYCVRLVTNDDSVDPAMIGRLVVEE